MTPPLYVCAVLLYASTVLAAPASQQLGKRYTFGTPGADATYDYVIVGGGTAGLTVAARLAANPSLSIAVVEAGGFYEQDNGNLSVVPGYDIFGCGTSASAIKQTPLVDWGFETIPQSGMNNRELHYARGKTLGGTSARNFMYYQRQTIGSAKKWADEVGDDSYTWSNMLPYYEKSVTYVPPATYGLTYTNSSNPQDINPANRTGAPLHVSFGGNVDPFSTWSQPALEAIGQKGIAGFSSGKLIGSAYVLGTINPDKGTRDSSETSFLQSVIGNTNLQVYKNTLAEKIVFQGKNASGVVVSPLSANGTAGPSYTLNARREIIISAGTFQSPQLLMVSGVGPQKVLQKNGVQVIKHAPGVGQNMWDHIFYATEFRVNVLTSSAGVNSPTAEEAVVEAWQSEGKGPLSSAGSMFLGWEKLPEPLRSQYLSAAQRTTFNSTFPDDWPELEFLPTPAPLGNQTNYLYSDPKNGFNYASMATALVAPLSRGNISIKSSKMSDPPLINPNYLTAPEDIQLAIAAFKRTRDAWRALANVTIGEEFFPGANVTSDSQILDFIKQSLAPVWHAAATCKMGKSIDPMAVIDPKAQVYGVKNLRVVDASSFPFLPPGHPQATVYALAEKIADDILKGIQ